MPQSLANLLVHVVFSTKDRRPLIDDTVRPKLHGYMAGILKEIESPALIINSVADHVHILCALSKNLAACKLVEEVKKSSSKWMKTQGVPLFSWQNGYGVFSVSESNGAQFVNTSRTSRRIIARSGFRKNFVGFWKNMVLNTTSVMCGIDFVAPFQGLGIIGALNHPGRCPGLSCVAPLGRNWTLI